MIWFTPKARHCEPAKVLWWADTSFARNNGTKTFGDDNPSIIITSTKSDKYDRYLADVFYETKTGEQFLNNRLLEEKRATRVGTAK